MTRWFAMRMAPVAVLAGLAVWMGPPLVEVWTARRAGLAAAEDQAGRLAHALSELAARQPRLWRYNAAKVVHAASAWADRPDVAGVTITDCGGEVWFSPERLGVGTGRPGGLTGWAAVASPRGTVAWVGVRRDDSGAAAARSMLHGASGILGLLVGLVLFLFPTAVVRRQATRLEEGRAVLRGQEEERGRVLRGVEEVRHGAPGLRVHLPRLVQTVPRTQPQKGQRHSQAHQDPTAIADEVAKAPSQRHHRPPGHDDVDHLHRQPAQLPAGGLEEQPHHRVVGLQHRELQHQDHEEAGEADPAPGQADQR